MSQNYLLVIHQNDQNHQFIKLEGYNIIIKIQRNQTHEFKKLMNQNYNLPFYQLVPRVI